MPLAPNNDKQRSTWERGTTAEFRFKFLTKNQTPITPIDSLKYPAYAIVTPSGIQVASGVATPFMTAGGYRVNWTIPEDAELSNEVRAWTLQINMLDVNNKQYAHNIEFNIVDKKITAAENRDLILLGLEGMNYRATWRGDFVPNDLRVTVFRSENPDDLQAQPLNETALSGLTQVIDGDSVAYYVTVPGTKLNRGSYTILWQVNETAASPTEFEYQQLRIIPKSLLQMIPQLKFIVGRFQAAAYLPNYISDADYVEGLQHGLDFINQWHPFSSYTIDEMLPMASVPNPLVGFWIMASAWWVLHSQHLVEASLAFNFSGATATLDYDRTSAIESAMGRLREEISQNLTPAKLAFKIRKQGFGHVSLRPARYAGLYNRVYRVEKQGGTDVNSSAIQLLGKLGILPQ